MIPLADPLSNTAVVESEGTVMSNEFAAKSTEPDVSALSVCDLNGSSAGRDDNLQSLVTAVGYCEPVDVSTHVVP